MNGVVYKMVLVLACGLLLGRSAFADLAPRQGPKVRLAVAQFGATDRFASVYGGWDIGGGLSAQLVTALIDTGRIVVVERAILSKVLIEQELGQAQLSSSFTQTPSGQLLGVDYLIVGEVTEFDERQMGGGSAFSILKEFGPKISSDASAAHVGIDLRVIDTRTGEILHSHRATGKAWDKAFGAKLDYSVIEFGGEVFHRTPLGQATRRAITDAVEFVLGIIEKRTEDFAWLARIIDIDGAYVYFDVGQQAQIAVGDQFRVSAVDKVLTDPETNEVLGLVQHDRGTVEAVQVELKYTKAKMLGNAAISTGDLVHALGPRSSMRTEQGYLSGYRVME